MKYIKQKLIRISKKLRQEQKGMTGLETAIILIAFVVIAAVFSYAILSAGVFTSNRAKEGAYVALQEMKSNLDLVGSVFAMGIPTTENQTGKCEAIKFNVRNSVGGTPINLTPRTASNSDNKCVINLLTRDIYYTDVYWSYVMVGDSDGDVLLEQGEQAQICVDLTDLGVSSQSVPYTDPQLGINESFSLQVKVVRGSNMTISRQLPAAISLIMDLH